MSAVTVDGERGRGRRPARPCSRPPAPPAAGCRRSASTSARRRSAPAGSASSASRARPAPLPACTTPCRDGMVDRHRRRAGAPRRRRGRRAACCPSCPSRPRRTPSWPQVARALGVGEPRWPGETHAPAPRHAPPLPRLPARAVHLVRALRARVRRGPGDLRADRDRPRLRREHRRRARRGLPRLGLRLLRRLRRHLSDRRDHRAVLAAATEVRQMNDERFDTTVTTTCGYCGVGCRLEAHARDGGIASIRPALDGPANHGHTCLKGRFAHQFSRHRERLMTPLIRERRRAARPRAGTRRSSGSPPSWAASGPLTAPTRSPASPPRARRTRTATRCRA